MVRTVAFAFVVALSARAAEAPGLAVAGDLPAPGSLKLEELKALGPVTVEWTVHGKSRRVVGVPLEKILTKAGFTPGLMEMDTPVREKRAGWKKAVVATASDGFQSVFSTAELFPEMGPTRAVVAWELDGKPLPANEAPFRLVVTTDKETSRSLYKLVKIEVVDLRAR